MRHMPHSASKIHVTKRSVGNSKGRRPAHSGVGPASAFIAVACFASGRIPQAAADAPEPPNELCVMPWGETPTRRGKFVVDGEVAKNFSAEQQRRRWDRVALDFQHNTVSPHKPGTAEHDEWLKKEPRLVAAYGTPEIREGEGIFLTNLRWTDAGKSSWKSYEDLSPGIIPGPDGRVKALHSAALCRAGEIEHLTLFAAAPPAPDFRGIFLTPSERMKTKLIAKLLEKAGVSVPADANDETLFALAAEHLGATAEDLKDESPEALDAAGLAEKVEALTAEVATLKAGEAKRQAADDKAQRDTLKRQAASEGKVIPLSDAEIDQTPVAILSAMIAKLPAGQVQTSHQDKTPAGDKVETLSAEEEAVAKQMGITPEQWQAHKKQAAAK